MVERGKVPWGAVAGVAGVAVVGVGAYLAYKGVSDFFGKFNDLIGNAYKSLASAGSAIVAAPGHFVDDNIKKPVDNWWVDYQSGTTRAQREAKLTKTTVTTYTPTNPPPAQTIVKMPTLVEKAIADLEGMDNWLPATKYKGTETWRDAMKRVLAALKKAPSDPTTLNNAGFFIQDVKAKFPTHYSKSGADIAQMRGYATYLYGRIMGEIIRVESSGNPNLLCGLADLHEAAGYCQQAIALCGDDY